MSLRLFAVAALALAACNAAPDRHTPPPPEAPRPATTATTAAEPPVIDGPKLMPVDEATADPSLAAFRDELLAAVRRRDVDAVVAAADPNILTSFGGGGGSAALRDLLRDARMWDELERILTLGGTFRGEGEQRMFWAPYVYSAWPESHDAFMSLAVIEPRAPLRTAPSASAPAAAMLSYDIIERASEPGADEGAWRRVKTADERVGFVAARSVRSPVDYRAGFRKTDHRWRMTALVAGD